MSRSWRWWLLGTMVFLGGMPCEAHVGTGSGAETHGFAPRPLEAMTWRIAGCVLTMRGEPLSDVVVHMDIGSKGEVRRSMKTNLQGEFRTEVRLDPAKFPRLRGTLVASKTGYLEGRETLDLGLDETNSVIYIVLRDPEEDPERLSLTDLVNAIGPHLRDGAVKRFAQEPGLKEFRRGCAELIDRDNAVAAIPLINNSVERTPDCIECRLLLSLALLKAGSWSSADKQLGQVSKANDASATKRPEPALVMGVMKAWRGSIKEAAGLYLHALEADPQNMLVLQELGRTAVAQKNWEAADQYLEKAIREGAGDSAKLLRVRALLELGDAGEAAREMDRYVADRGVKDLPPAVRALSREVQSRLGLLSYNQVKSIITQSPKEIITALPDLQGLEANTDQSILGEVLQRTGEGVEVFFKSFPNTVSLEQVRQERLGKDGQVRASLDQEFNYLLLANAERPGMGIEEHRSTAEGQDSSLAGLHQGFMLTKGFASTSSIFHPINRSGADFRYLGKQTLDDHETYVVAFAQRPETAKMVTRFVTDKSRALILVQGVSWVDSKTFHIIRLHTFLLHPLPDVRLQRLTTEIQFHQVTFNEGKTALWLPKEVKVMVDWRGRLLRNQHRYSDFKLFNVESKEERKPPQLPAAPSLEQPQ